MTATDEDRSSLIAEISGLGDVTHDAIERVLKALDEMGCVIATPAPTSVPTTMTEALTTIDRLRRQLAANERKVREQLARELIDWAGEPADDGPFGPRAARRRHIQAAARHISPKLTPAEIAEAINSGNAIACHLDDAGRAHAAPVVDRG